MRVEIMIKWEVNYLRIYIHHEHSLKSNYIGYKKSDYRHYLKEK